MVTDYAKTLANCVVQLPGEVPEVPTVSCNRAIATLKIPESFEAEELGVAPARSCKRCRGCKDCSYRSTMISREKELVVQRIEDLIKYDAETHIKRLERILSKNQCVLASLSIGQTDLGSILQKHQE